MKNNTVNKTPFRIGTTSYIIPADILPNIRFLASKVDDVELVLFEVNDGAANLPDENTILELKHIAAQNDLTYTVHLPLDLRLGENNQLRQQSIHKALQVIDRTCPLEPYAYVLHLDGRQVRSSYRSNEWEKWQELTSRALRELVGQMENPTLLAVENLEGYPPAFWDDILEDVPVSRCIDIGHLWLDGHDPLLYLEAHLSRARVLHIHGCIQRDHQSLAHIEEGELQRIIGCLMAKHFQGVLTMEIFGEADFHSSLDTLLNCVHQMNLEARWENH